MLTVFEVGEKIAIARKLKNLSQSQLAEMLAVTAQAVGKWERGESMPDIITFGRLAEVLGVDLNYFGDKQPAALIMPNIPQPPMSEERTEQQPGWDMSHGNWIDADFSGLRGLADKFSGANIERSRFVGSELSGLTLKGNNIRQDDFSQSVLKGCKFTNANLENDNFSDCDFTGSEFIRSNVKNCDFSGAQLTDVLFKWCNIQKFKLFGSVLLRTSFQFGQLTDITFDGEIQNCSFENCDFARVEFRGAVIRNTFFKNSKLKRAKFIACQTDKLTYAFMKSCKADLSDVEIIGEA